MQWLLWLEDGCQIGLYCSDVSGAFDKVCKTRLSWKLNCLKVPRCIAQFLETWLSDRKAVVVADGSFSTPFDLTDSVFQGTVLRPPMWNQHFSDARASVNALGYFDTTYADDMNIFKKFDRSISHDDIFTDLHRCQEALHKWGAGNRVAFDPAKEHFHVIHRLHPSHSTFKILGESCSTAS